MTQKPNKLLYRTYLCLTASLIIPLVGFFVYAIYYNTSFFLFLEIGLLLSIIYLIPLRSRFSKRQASVELQIQDVNERANLVEVEMLKERKAIESFRDKIVDYAQLKGLTERLSLCLTLEDTSKALSDEVNKLFGDDDSTIILYLFHSKTGELGITSSQKGQMRVNLKAKKGDVFDGWIVKNMQPLLIDDTKSDYRFDVDKIILEELRLIRSLISVPLMVGYKAIGILRVDSSREHCFSTEDLRFLKTIGDLGAVAIENAQLHERVEQLAIRDSLTELYLRRYLLERMETEIIRQLRGKKSMSFLMIDLDNFKKYNDKFGHMAGDIVLKTIGILLDEFFNEAGILVCRFGGEEFSVMLPDCSKKKAKELAEAIRKKVEMQIIPLRREKTQITISIGIATLPEDSQSKEELIHKADLALYQAKEKGRNRVCLAA